jgi:hypothetical protein
MKIRSYLLAVGVFILLLSALWLWRNRLALAEKAKVTTATERSTNAGVSNGVASNSIASNPNSAPVTGQASGTHGDKVGLIGSMMALANSKSLEFYGKIIDQDGNPVGGVNVDAGVGLILDAAHSGGKDFYTESDPDGNFSFVGIRGAGVGFTLTKEGYTYNRRLASSNRPNDYIPNPQKPVIFTIWKLRGAESMVHTTIRESGLACDGTPREFDLMTGHRDTGGFVAELNRNPLNIDGGKPFDWTLTLKVTGGGLIAITDAYPNEAPSDGYQATVEIIMHANDSQWTPELARSYYVFDGKNYGRVTINIVANYQPPPTLFDIDAYINPSGSRNLEFEPGKQKNQ